MRNQLKLIKIVNDEKSAALQFFFTSHLIKNIFPSYNFVNNLKGMIVIRAIKLLIFIILRGWK